MGRRKRNVDLCSAHSVVSVPTSSDLYSQQIHQPAMKLLGISLVLFFARATVCDYVVDDTPGLGRRFDGIGGLSGGGVSARF